MTCLSAIDNNRLKRSNNTLKFSKIIKQFKKRVKDKINPNNITVKKYRYRKTILKLYTLVRSKSAWPK